MALPNLVVAGVTIQPITEAATGEIWTSSTYYAQPPLGQVPIRGDDEFEEAPVFYPGVDGVGTKSRGFRGTDLDADIIFLSDTLANARALRDVLHDAMVQSRFVVTTPGGAAENGWKLKRQGLREVKWFTLSGRIALQAELHIRRMDNL